MNSVESAASLFGSDDAGPDPFAALGSDGAETTSKQSAHNSQGQPPLSSEQHDPHNVAASLFGQEDSSNAEQAAWSEPTSQDPYAYNASAYSQDQSNGYGYDDRQAQGWYDEHGQWQTYPYTQPIEIGEFNLLNI